jgi:hypothetical protein
MSPATTGETANGRSMAEVSSVRPGKRKRTMAQAAASPKTMFRATATGATVKVSRIALQVSASFHRRSKYASGPSRNASQKTFASGTRMSRATAATAMTIKSLRTAAGSSCA